MKTTILLSIAKKEIMDNFRNKWIILVSVIFALLTLVVSYFGSMGRGWQDLGLTIAGMMLLVQYLIPIIGLMLGYGAVTGEIERGSMSALLSLPSTRKEILFGKFIGLGLVLSLTILIGFGVAGAIIALNVSGVNYADYLIFIGASILMALVFVSFALFLSAFFKKRSTALGAAIFFWFFFALIYSIIMSGILIYTVGIENLISGTTVNIPDWYYGIELLNPLSAYSALVGLNVGPVANATQGTGVTIQYPWFYTTGLMLLILFVWIVAFLILALWRFNKRDV
jgi:Cu-processing system permease protein